MYKITYIISNINKALEFEWAANELTTLGYKLNFILLNKGHSELETFLLNNKIDCTTILFRNKYDILSSIYKIYKILRITKPDIVHCHLFEATISGLIASKLAGINKRIHTRHHSTWHHKYHKRVVLFDKLNNKLSSKIIAVSKVVEDILLKENVSNNKIEVVYHGINIHHFDKVESDRILTLQTKYNKENKSPIIGVISRYTVWKGIQFIIPAFKKLQKDYPDSILILANANGEYSSQIRALLGTLPNGSYKELSFENDIFALYKLFSIFVHVPIDHNSEAFGQIYIEALASRIPMICTKSGIGFEILQHENNAYIVPFEDAESIYQGFLTLLKDEQKRNKLAENGFETVKYFTLERKISRLNQIYKELLNYD